MTVITVTDLFAIFIWVVFVSSLRFTNEVGLLLAEALEGAAGLFAGVCLDVIVVVNSVLCKTRTIVVNDVVTVDLWVRISDLARVGCNNVDRNERTKQEDRDNHESEGLALYVIPVGEMSVFPDDICWLRSIDKLHGLAKELLGASVFQGKHLTIFFLKSDEC